MRGRKLVPTALKLAAGNPGKRPLNRSEPKAPAVRGHPRPPTWFDAVARKKWRELVGLLRAMGLLTKADLDHVRAYCAAYSRWTRAEAKLAATGGVITYEGGGSRVDPWLRVAREALERLDKSGAELGLSPTARARLKVEPKPPTDDLADFLQSRPKVSPVDAG